MATGAKDLSAYDRSSIPSAKGLRVGIVVAQWNSEITEALYKGAFETLVDCGVIPSNIIRYTVPGSFELIYGCKLLITREKLDAAIAIGSVIKGETDHFQFICGAVSGGIRDLNLQLDTPVIFCVLTDDTMEQARARSGGKHGNKGVEAAIAAIRMATL